MYLKSEPPTVQERWLKLTMPVLTENFIMLQDISNLKNEEFNLLQNLNFGVQITTWFLSFYGFSLVFMFFLNLMKKFMTQNVVPKPKFNIKKIVSNCLRMAESFCSTSPSLSIFILLFELYLWLFMLMVVNTTKTNKVVSALFRFGPFID